MATVLKRVIVLPGGQQTLRVSHSSGGTARLYLVPVAAGAAVELAGTIAAVAVSQGQPAGIRLMAGAVGGSAMVQGQPLPVHALTGTVAAVASSTAALVADFRLAGTVGAYATVAGNLGTLGVTNLSGSLAATSGLSGDVGLVQEFSGQIRGSSSVAGDFAGLVSLAGQLGASSTTAGDPIGEHELVGAVAARCGLQGFLFGARTIWDIEGRVSALTATAGEIETVPAIGPVPSTYGPVRLSGAASLFSLSAASLLITLDGETMDYDRLPEGASKRYRMRVPDETAPTGWKDLAGHTITGEVRTGPDPDPAPTPIAGALEADTHIGYVDLPPSASTPGVKYFDLKAVLGNAVHIGTVKLTIANR